MEKLIYKVLCENPTLKSLSMFGFRVKGFAEADFEDGDACVCVRFQPGSFLRVNTCFPRFYDQFRHILFHLISRD